MLSFWRPPGGRLSTSASASVVFSVVPAGAGRLAPAQAGLGRVCLAQAGPGVMLAGGSLPGCGAARHVSL